MDQDITTATMSNMVLDQILQRQSAYGAQSQWQEPEELINHRNHNDQSLLWVEAVMQSLNFVTLE
eukprot:5709039-Amphidinium_carterae.2